MVIIIPDGMLLCLVYSIINHHVPYHVYGFTVNSNLKLPFLFVDPQRIDRTENDSVNGYEVIERTNPYSDYQSINEYDMISDVHSNIMHDSSNPDINHSVCVDALPTAGTCNRQQHSNPEQKSSTIERTSTDVASQTVSQESAKPVYRKTPVPSRRMGGKSRNHLTVLPYLQKDFANSPTLAAGIPMDVRPKNISVSPKNKYDRDIKAANEHASVPETGKQLGPLTVCGDSNDALSVYDIYTIP